ncbi:type I restriction enzyme, R subunit [Catalinimonas alkaloidigena]|uniref:Type I restriction enzyme endonuclease subunit n=1 Tax=Catalinimonas alkaloidigena TaxID=1075417 RepID=A0A1G9QIW6_9BACT|nr:type I restriction endonuclease subunit R [Catalinimonas alkaloidigena]SDM10962.1 type I restriction enzyme, R subunit [Catalinimonas alkaloidigena]
MPFNELNSVEYFIIQRLSGVNLNQPQPPVSEDLPAYGSGKWKYSPAKTLKREPQDVLLESELKVALARLNPEIQANPALADEVIYKLRAILLTVTHVGLVRANEEFSKWIRGEKTMPFGENNRYVPVRLIDFDDPDQNRYLVTNQLRVTAHETKIPDVVLFINGLPVIVGEAKTPIRPSVSWLDGAHEVHSVYENSIPQLFVPNLFSFATEGKDLYYGGIRSPLQFWAPWRLQDENTSGMAKALGLQEIGSELSSLLDPRTVLDMLQHFAIFATDKKKRRIKIVARFQQYGGTNLLVDRVRAGQIKKGLIWHFQGSGKSLLMVFAAQKLRKDPALKSPTVIILVDRVDLDTQITGTFNAADVPNLIATDSIEELTKLLKADTRKIITTTIYKFRDAQPHMNERHNIIVLVDEAHRTQEGDLARKMRAALPNAFFFGLTGTPINKADKNTFWAFGSEHDEGGYLTRYTFQDSLRDNATLKLHFEPRLVNVHVDKVNLDKLFREMIEEAALSDEQADALSKKAAKMAAFLKSPERIATIVEDIAQHFREKVEPHGFKAMIVTPDRYACIQYKEELDKRFPEDASLVVISTSANDDWAFKQRWGLDKEQLEKKIELFEDKDSPMKFVIVTAKLLTGFDAPILQTMYLDKSLKDHTLLQAICRTNRLYPNKKFGRIVDYFGIFDDAALALQFDEQSVHAVISNLQELREQLPDAVAKCLQHFASVDRTLVGFEGLEAAQSALPTDEGRDAFAQDYNYLNKIWESLSPDNVLNPHQEDYRWLSAVYQSLKPASDNIGKLWWHALGAKTTELIHQNIHVTGIDHELSEYVLDANVIDDLFQNPDPKEVKKLERVLVNRFKKRAGQPRFQELSERLETLRSRAEAGLITSIEFIKELCKLAQETVEAEKEELDQQEQKTAKAALTELFLEARTDQTPAIAERIVNDIDNIVKVVRFPGWQTTSSGEREVQKSLRKALLKYQLHKEQALFEKAYAYIKAYY